MTNADMGRHINTPEVTNMLICAMLDSTTFVLGALAGHLVM